ncbi:MAG: ribosome small subunit-dependent GTPase A [Planctomycetes bacterium]|nr:ribosome small subunit-dependent GTPase A [Planctomycetota bacterium]
MSERGLVTSVGSRSVTVFVEGKGVLRCTLRGNLWAAERGETRPVAVGDRVQVKLESGTEGVVESVDERANRLARHQPAGRFSGQGRTHTSARSGKDPPVQVIAANLDRIVIVAALLDPPFRAGLVDRLVVAAHMQGIEPVLVLNKVDLEGTEARPGDRGGTVTRDVARPWIEDDMHVIATSTVTGEGTDALRELLAQGVNLLVGHSGVGKTSLLNVIAPQALRATGSVTSYHGRGRHTTTQVRLVPLDSGGWMVDSPGMREFGLEDVRPADLARLFTGFGELPDACKFNDCLHRTEPGCAVRTAVDAGEIAEERYDVYRRILDGVEGEAV